MQFTFDSEQPHQRAAIDAALELFTGQSRLPPDMATANIPGHGDMPIVPNRLVLTDAALLENLRRVQALSRLPLAPGGADTALAKITMPFDDDPGNGLLAGRAADFPNFSVEMETGTGKTYVYLRTIREMAKRYGFMKFIVVVPSIAVREGVLHAMRSTDSHLSQMCQIDCDSVRYNSEHLGDVAAFAQRPRPQAMVMTIDSFRRKETRMRRWSEGLMGDTPLHFIQAARPILILDEPQNMEKEKAKTALALMNPLFALRYSATHRRCYNMIHRLSPMEAYQAGLVKRLVVDGVEGGDTNAPYFRLASVKTDSPVPSARVEVRGETGRRQVTMKCVDTLGEKTGLPQYKGFQLLDIRKKPPGAIFSDPNAEWIRLNVGEAHGKVDQAELFRAQISATIQDHFLRQSQLRTRGIKVLSLFFIDKVANYRGDGTEKEVPLIRRIFEEEFDRQKKGEWKNIKAADVHKGYFAKSMGGNSEADALAYQLIMRDKESLLTFPNRKTDDKETLAKRQVAFIFTHSALREGWDNPNIFQICTLNETLSESRKRQEIGRGVRLAVNQNGNRILDESVNVLTVIPNRNYGAFVSAYQGEITRDYTEMVRERFGADWSGLTKEEREWAESYRQEFTPPPAEAKRENARANNLHIRAGKGGKAKFSPPFERLWNRIQQRTEYIVKINSDKLADSAVAILRKMRIPGMEIIRTKALVEMSEEGRFSARVSGKTKTPVRYSGPLPDAVKVVNEYLESGPSPLRLSRPTILRIIRADVQRAMDNPFGWSRCAADAIRQALAETLDEAIVYEKVDDHYEWRQAYEREFPIVSEHIARLSGVKNSAYDSVACDSNVEKQFAEELAKRDDVKLFLKLPRWFTVPTPVGDYNPDWAILFTDGKGGEKLALVAETKGAVDARGNIQWSDIRQTEKVKIHSAAAHFGSRQLRKKGALDGTDYKVAKSAGHLFAENGE